MLLLVFQFNTIQASPNYTKIDDSLYVGNKVDYVSNLPAVWSKIVDKVSGTTISYIIYDCKNSKILILKGVRYDKQGNFKGSYDNTSTLNIRLKDKFFWEQVPVESKAEFFKDYVCRNKR